MSLAIADRRIVAARLAWALFVLLGVAPPASADDRAAARQAFAEGSKYYDLNQYAEALEAFKRAYWSYEEPTILYDIAQCHRLLGHNKEALEFYRSYLRRSPDAPNRHEVERMIAELQSATGPEKPISSATPPGTMGSEYRPARPPDSRSATPGAGPLSAGSHAASTAAAARTDEPLWRRRWLWGVVGGVVVAGVAVGLGVGLGTQARPPRADAQVAF